jgi:hypothetical protein
MAVLLKPTSEAARQLGIHQEFHAARGTMRDGQPRGKRQARGDAFALKVRVVRKNFSGVMFPPEVSRIMLTG